MTVHSTVSTPIFLISAVFRKFFRGEGEAKLRFQDLMGAGGGGGGNFSTDIDRRIRIYYPSQVMVGLEFLSINHLVEFAIRETFRPQKGLLQWKRIRICSV